MYQTSQHQQFTLNLLVSNKPGVLGRVTLVFSRRGYNIESLNVKHTLDRKFSLVTVTTEGSAHLLDDIIKQVRKLIDVIEAEWDSLSTSETLEHKQQYSLELKPSQSKPVILSMIADSPFQIIDFSENSLSIQGPEPKGRALIFIEMMKHYGHVSRMAHDCNNTLLGETL